jgi:hypothetical protein
VETAGCKAEDRDRLIQRVRQAIEGLLAQGPIQSA